MNILKPQKVFLQNLSKIDNLLENVRKTELIENKIIEKQVQ